MYIDVWKFAQIDMWFVFMRWWEFLVDYRDKERSNSGAIPFKTITVLCAGKVPGADLQVLCVYTDVYCIYTFLYIVYIWIYTCVYLCVCFLLRFLDCFNWTRLLSLQNLPLLVLSCWIWIVWLVYAPSFLVEIVTRQSKHKASGYGCCNTVLLITLT